VKCPEKNLAEKSPHGNGPGNLKSLEEAEDSPGGRRRKESKNWRKDQGTENEGDQIHSQALRC